MKNINIFCNCYLFLTSSDIPISWKVSHQHVIDVSTVDMAHQQCIDSSIVNKSFILKNFHIE